MQKIIPSISSVVPCSHSLGGETGLTFLVLGGGTGLTFLVLGGGTGFSFLFLGGGMGLILLIIFLGMGTGLVLCVGMSLVFGAGMGFVVDTGISNLTLGVGMGFVFRSTLRIGLGVGMGPTLRACSIMISLVMLPSRNPFEILLRRASWDGSNPFRCKYLIFPVSPTFHSRKGTPLHR